MGGNGEDSAARAGNDELDGGNGQDTVNGGTGDDVLTGGNGPDQFIFNAGFGDDVVTDFKNNDLIQFDDDLFENSRSGPAGERASGRGYRHHGGINTVTLLGVQMSSLQTNDFSILGKCCRIDFATVIRQRRGTLGAQSNLGL